MGDSTYTDDMILLTICSSVSAENLENDEQYKDDFESFSTTPQEAPSSSVSLSSKTIGNVEIGTDEQHGFTLSPIHISDTQIAASASDGGSNLEQSSPLGGAKPAGESIRMELKPVGEDVRMELKPVGENMGIEPTSPLKHKVSTGSSDRGLLLEKRSSKPFVLNTEQLPSSGSTPQDLLNSSTESSKSAISHLSSASGDAGHLRKLTPLAPLAREHAATPEGGGVDSTSSISGKDTYILKPLETDKPSDKAGLGKSASAQSVSGKMDSHDSGAPVVVSVNTDDPALVRSNTSTSVGAAQLTNVPPPSMTDHVNVSTKNTNAKAVVDTLTEVTDMPNSSVADFISQLAELQSSSLVVDEPPPVTSTQQSSQPQSQLQGSTQTTSSDFPHQTIHSHDTALTDKVDQPTSDSVYGDMDIQNIIRAITCEEIASIGKDILQTKRKQSQSPPPQVPKGSGRARTAKHAEYGVKLKPGQKGVAGKKAGISSREQKGVEGVSSWEQKGVGVSGRSMGVSSRERKGLGFSGRTTGVSSREQKGVGIPSKEQKDKTRQRVWQGSAPQGMVKQKKAGLYSSRESLASKSDSSSVQKKSTSVSARARSQLSGRGKENSFRPPRQLAKKSNPPQRSSKNGTNACKTDPGRSKQQAELSPETSHRPYSPPTESSISSPTSTVDLKVDFNIHSPGAPQGENFSETTNEPFRKEVHILKIHCIVLPLIQPPLDRSECLD